MSGGERGSAYGYISVRERVCVCVSVSDGVCV